MCALGGASAGATSRRGPCRPVLEGRRVATLAGLYAGKFNPPLGSLVLALLHVVLPGRPGTAAPGRMMTAAMRGSTAAASGVDGLRPMTSVKGAGYQVLTISKRSGIGARLSPSHFAEQTTSRYVCWPTINSRRLRPANVWPRTSTRRAGGQWPRRAGKRDRAQGLAGAELSSCRSCC